MIFSFNIRFLIFIWASGRAFRLKHIRFAHTRLQSLTRFTTLRNIYGSVIQDDREVFALPSSRIINFSLSLKMCKDKVGLKYPFINLYQKSLNIRARKRTRTFNNFYYRTPNVYFFPALLFCTSRKKRKKIYFRALESGLPHAQEIVRPVVRQRRPLSSHPANSSDIPTMPSIQTVIV